MGLWERVRGARSSTHEPDASWLIAGFGNPGDRYTNTRHNAGARAVETLARSLGVKMKPSKSRAIAGEGRSDNTRVVLARATTYYNEVGQAIAPLLRWYKIDPGTLIVIHDDIDLQFGELRVKVGGGSGGNHGIESLCGSLGTKDFYRVRIGVGRPADPRHDPADFVLETMSPKVREELGIAEERAGEAALAIIHEGLERAMNRYN